MANDPDILAVALPQIKAEEGCRLNAYLDTLGIPTIGWGHTGPEVHIGLAWKQDQADAQLATDVQKFITQLDRFAPWWRSLDTVRAATFLEIVFQMGVGVLMKFPHACAALEAGNWQGAHDGFLYANAPGGPSSSWAQQTPARSQREATQILTGVVA